MSSEPQVLTDEQAGLEALALDVADKVESLIHAVLKIQRERSQAAHVSTCEQYALRVKDETAGRWQRTTGEAEIDEFDRGRIAAAEEIASIMDPKGGPQS